MKDQWIDIKSRLPGTQVTKCLFLFDDRSTRTYDASKVDITGVFRIKENDIFTEHIVTHWQPIEFPE